MTGPELIERVARALEPSAFATYDRGATVQNLLAEVAFLNAEKVIKRARKKAGIALAALLAATREPSEAMLAAGRDCDFENRRAGCDEHWYAMHDALARELGGGNG